MPDTGSSLRQDLRHLIATSPFFDDSSPDAASFAAPVAESTYRPSLIARYRANDRATTLAAREAFERAIAQGEVPVDLDVGTAADILSGMLFARALTGQAAPPALVTEEILDFVLRGICVR